VLCGPLETLLHDWSGLSSVVLLATEAFLLVEDDSTLAHLHMGVDLLHELSTVRAEDILHAVGAIQVLAELGVSHTSCPEDGGVGSSRSCTCNPIVVDNASVISVDLESLESVLVGGRDQLFLITV